MNAEDAIRELRPDGCFVFSMYRQPLHGSHNQLFPLQPCPYLFKEIAPFFPTSKTAPTYHSRSSLYIYGHLEKPHTYGSLRCVIFNLQILSRYIDDHACILSTSHIINDIQFKYCGWKFTNLNYFFTVGLKLIMLPCSISLRLHTYCTKEIKNIKIT